MGVIPSFKFWMEEELESKGIERMIDSQSVSQSGLLEQFPAS